MNSKLMAVLERQYEEAARRMDRTNCAILQARILEELRRPEVPLCQKN